jgi:hypothetical protein
MIKTPFCGRPGCEGPGFDVRVAYSAFEAEKVFLNKPGIGCILCLRTSDCGGSWKFCTSAADAAEFYRMAAPGPTTAEWDTLWSWHFDRQHEASNKEDYAEAQHHKQRAAEIRPLTSFGK